MVKNIFSKINDVLGEFWDRLTPQRSFLWTAIIGGVILCFLTPPFQVADEVVHFFRAYQVSQGIVATQAVDYGYGGVLPTNIADLPHKLSAERIRFVPTEKFDVTTSWNALTEPLKPKQTTKVRFENTAAYSPVAYLPQSIGIFIGREIGMSPLEIMWMGRLSNLALWIVLVYFAIAIIPFGKWGVYLIALTPMSIFQAVSLSPDAITNGTAFLLVALSLKLIYVSRRATKIELALTAALIAVLGLTKITYLPLSLLLLLIPRQTFGGAKRKAVLIAIFITVAALLSAYWNYKTRNAQSLALAMASVSLSFKIEPIAQLKIILIEPIFYIKVLWNTFFTASGDGLLQGYFGVLGWLDTKLPLWVIFSDASLIFMMLLGAKTNQKIKKVHRVFLVGLILILATAVATALYLYYSPIGSKTVIGLQGRYFIPILILLVPICANSTGWVQPSELMQKKIATIGGSLVLIAAFITIAYRYYPLSFF